ncbi:MAG: CoA pyrophosphatase [Chloroflexi bacterium]|nr:CoA pyrophosphatase [Chloroflexota bacterium]MCH9010581.1 CoA pyrophosphatase [Chloroflexota bacterium]
MEESATELIRRILTENPKKTVVDSSLTPAGVTLLLYPKDGEYCILLNKRTDTVDDHKGEISFPGGRKDPEDKTLLDTALRETHEEMGISPDDVDVLGEIDDVPTNTSYLISTFVGTIPYPYEFAPSEAEVAEVLEVPISTLMDINSARDEVRVRDGELVNSVSYSYDGHLIFGATARILSRFLELLDTAPEREAPWKSVQI